ncbi:MAG: hypothetical protein ABI605_11080 [Rhizobacter sp.]
MNFGVGHAIALGLIVVALVAVVWLACGPSKTDFSPSDQDEG